MEHEIRGGERGEGRRGAWGGEGGERERKREGKGGKIGSTSAIQHRPVAWFQESSTLVNLLGSPSSD